MLEKVFSSFILFSVAAGCFMTMVEVKKANALKGSIFGSRPRRGTDPGPGTWLRMQTASTASAQVANVTLNTRGPRDLV